MPDSKAKTKEPIPLRSKNGMAAAKKGKRGGMKRYMGELRSEFKKIIWPGRRLVAHNTLVVLVTILAIGLLVAGLDALSSLGFNALLKV